MVAMRYTKIAQGEVINDELRHISIDDFRQIRNRVLLLTDRYMLVDHFDALTEEQQAEIKAFRKTLRELPELYEGRDPKTFRFPAFPEFIKQNPNIYFDPLLFENQMEADYYADHPDEMPDGWSQY